MDQGEYLLSPEDTGHYYLSGISFYVSKESKNYFQLISSRTDSVNILLGNRHITKQL